MNCTRNCTRLATFVLLITFGLGGLSPMAGGQGLTETPVTAEPAPPPDAKPDQPDQPAQPVKPAPPTKADVPFADRRTGPSEAMFFFLEAMNAIRDGDEDAWLRAEACLDLAGADIEPGSNQSRTVIKQLYGILNRLEKVDPSYLPAAKELAEREQRTGRATSRFVYFPNFRLDWVTEEVPNLDRRVHRIVLERHEDAWRFNGETARNIGTIYKMVEPLPLKIGGRYLNFADWIQQHLPESMRRYEFLTLATWQWIGLFLLILAGVIVDALVRLLLRLLTGYIVRRQEGQVERDSIINTVRPIGLFVGSLVWLNLLFLLDLPTTAYAVLKTAINVLIILSATWGAWRITDLACEVAANKASDTQTKFDDVVVPLIRKAVKVFIVAFGLIYLAKSLQFDVIPMLTGLGVGSLAFAFAAKDTIENFFGSIAVIADRPFEVGDWIVIGDVEGIVEEVGFRSTRIRTFYNSLVTVPNANLVRAEVDNYGKRKYRRWKTNISVTYDTPPDRILAFCEGIRELIRTHPYTRKDYFHVWLNQFQAASLDIMLYMFFDVPDWGTELRERERLFLDILRLADRLGVEFAFPTQTLHIYQEEHGEQQSKLDVPGSLADRRSMVTGIRAARELIENQPWRDEKPGPVVFSDRPTDIDGESLGDGGGDRDEGDADKGDGDADKGEGDKGDGGTFIEDRTAGG